MKEDWFWAADNSGTAGDRFVVANGKDDLWSRVRIEVVADERCSWNAFQQTAQKASLANCMHVFLIAREMYGVSYNRLVLEMAQVPAFAEFIKSAPSDLGNWVSNPIVTTPLVRVGYDAEIVERLGCRITETLDIEEDWWR